MLPVLYFPTRILLIDDSINYLKSLDINLNHSAYHSSLYTSPKDALEFINSYPKDPLSKNLFSYELTDQFQQQSIHFKINQTHPLMAQLAKDPPISTIIVDYNMPEMNGLEFLSKIDHRSIKKCLLTGEADELVAVEAFNNNFIDRYIKKSDPNVIPKLLQFIEKSQTSFFSPISQFVTSTISENDPRSKAYTDKCFLINFKRLISDYDIIEYYLLDSIGSYLLKNSQGLLYILNTQNEEQAATFIEILDNFEKSEISNEKISEIRNKQRILCYASTEGHMYPSKNSILEFFHPCQKIEGEDTFYTTLQPYSINT